MAIYNIQWRTSAVKDLKSLDRKMVPRIITSVEQLKVNPYPSGVKKLTGSDGTYRKRVGNYRVVYEVSGTTLTILIIRIGHRKDVYKTL